jgi:hypothetical protein
VLVTVVNRNAAAPRDLHLEGFGLWTKPTEWWRSPVSLLETRFVPGVIGHAGNVSLKQASLIELVRPKQKGKSASSRRELPLQASAIQIPAYSVMQVVLPC